MPPAARLPDEVRRLLAGEPEDDTWEDIAQLLTSDDDGYPRVCLLSRAELTAGDRALGCVLRARHTLANLRRDGRASLVVTGEQAAHYVRLRARRFLEATDGSGRTAVAFDVTGAAADTLGVPLRPMRFRSSSRIRLLEQTGSNREFLERLGLG